MSLVAASWRQPLPAKSMAELGWVMVIPTLVLLLAFAVPSTRSLWEYCDDAVWDGWGAVCCGENNLWKMGYCTSDGNFTLMCPTIQLGVCSTLEPPSWLDRAYTDSLMRGIARIRLAEQLEAAQVPANLSRLARGHACWLENEGAGANASTHAGDRRRLIETFGMRYNFFDGENIPCPVVTNVSELYTEQDSPSAVIEQWLADSDAADVLRSDYTALGLGTYTTSRTDGRYVAIFVTVQDYTYINASLCPEGAQEEYDDL